MLRRNEGVSIAKLQAVFQYQPYTVRARQAAREGLRSKPRILTDGRTVDGREFTRGQLYYLLHNPIYIGKIRHKDQSYAGLHELILDLGLWTRVQKKLEINAARPRQSALASSRSFIETSPLAGKLYDETSGRLTPSHANKNGKCHRYYVSSRLIKNPQDRNDKPGWRLPAKQLEQQIAGLIAERITSLACQLRLISVPKAEEGLALIDRAKSIENNIKKNGIKAAADLIEACTIAPGALTILLDRSQLAKALSVTPDGLADDALILGSPFQLRRRGVEAKIVSGIKVAEPDHKLIELLAKAHGWLERMLQGEALADIARRDGHAKYYVGSRSCRQLAAGHTGGHTAFNNDGSETVQSDLSLNWHEQERMFLQPL